MLAELARIKDKLVLLEDHAANKLWENPFEGKYNPWRGVRTALDEAIFRIKLAMEDIEQYHLE